MVFVFVFVFVFAVVVVVVVVLGLLVAHPPECHRLRLQVTLEVLSYHSQASEEDAKVRSTWLPYANPQNKRVCMMCVRVRACACVRVYLYKDLVLTSTPLLLGSLAP